MWLHQIGKTKIMFLALILSSFTCQSTSKIVITSIPKGGTNLVVKCVKAITGRGHQESNKWVTLCEDDGSLKDLLMTHAIYTPEHAKILEKNNFKGIVMLRDPRDQAVSMVHYAKKMMHHPRLGKRKKWPQLAELEFNEALIAWISDTSHIYSPEDGGWSDKIIQSFKSIDDLYRKYLPWTQHPLFYTATFEKLVGPKGGGNKDDQIQEIMNIAQHIDHPISEQRAEEIAEELFGGSWTFRNGQIGEYKTSFTKEHTKLFKEKAGQLLIDLGYEKDFEW